MPFFEIYLGSEDTPITDLSLANEIFYFPLKSKYGAIRYIFPYSTNGVTSDWDTYEDDLLGLSAEYPDVAITLGIRENRNNPNPRYILFLNREMKEISLSSPPVTVLEYNNNLTKAT